MKRSYFFPVVAATLFITGCSNSNTADPHKDSANTLQDTFPANGLKDSLKENANAVKSNTNDTAHHPH